MEAARLLLEKGRLSLDVIADEVGFADRERMRRAFLRTIGQPPQAVRRFSRSARAGNADGGEQTLAPPAVAQQAATAAGAVPRS